MCAVHSDTEFNASSAQLGDIANSAKSEVIAKEHEGGLVGESTHIGILPKASASVSFSKAKLVKASLILALRMCNCYSS